MGISDSALLSERSSFMAKQTENMVGIYMRLSKENMQDGDSLSIENQKMMLTKFILEKGWMLVSEYVDDGYSGHLLRDRASRDCCPMHSSAR